MEDAPKTRDYFTVRSVPHAGSTWTFADAHNVLLVVFGVTERSGRLVLIRQFRPPFAADVLSAPMGCFADSDIETLASLAATEAEAETGHQVLRIAHLVDFARSPGLTTERAKCFVACYAENAGPQQLHADESIAVEYVASESIPTVVGRAAAAGELLDSTVLLCGSWLFEHLTAIQKPRNA